MRRQIEDLVVVVTGASSGIGRATARALADRGAKVVLAARRQPQLEECAEECGRLGCESLVVPTDVTDEDAVERLAQKAVSRFGGIDVWINDAGVGMYSHIEDAPTAAHRRVLETNVFGTLYGSRAAVKRFRKQGRGHLINVASVVATAGFPYNAAYVASKYAIRGLTESLRVELRGSGIEVSTIFPAAIDTPFFQHAANYMGRGVKPPSPVYAPEKVAEAIVGCIERPRAEVFVGGSARMIDAARALLGPTGYDPLSKGMTEEEHFQEETQRPTAGSLFKPRRDGLRVRGGWGAGEAGPTGATPGVGLAVLGIAGAAAALWYLSRRGDFDLEAEEAYKTAESERTTGFAHS
jgi:short-subunit dehydrogenase